VGSPLAEVSARYGPGIRLSAGPDPLAPGRPVLVLDAPGRVWLGSGELDEMIDALEHAREACFGRDDA